MRIPNIVKSYVNTRAGQFHVRACGTGPPLLLLHQSPSSGAMWESVLPLLSNGGFLAIAPDLPGSGGSFAFSEPPAIADYADSMLALADALQLEAFDVVGHHTGAAVALQMAADAADRVRKVVAWGIPLLDEALHQRLLQEVAPSFDDHGDEIAAYWARRRRLSGSAYSPRLGVRHAIEMLQSGFARPWPHWAVAQMDLPKLLRTVDQPVLVMCGQLDPVWARSREAARTLPHAEFALIEGAGLDVVDEYPQAFANLALRFLST